MITPLWYLEVHAVDASRRKLFGQDKPKSTILIHCWVDKTKYVAKLVSKGGKALADVRSSVAEEIGYYDLEYCCYHVLFAHLSFFFKFVLRRVQFFDRASWIALANAAPVCFIFVLKLRHVSPNRCVSMLSVALLGSGAAQTTTLVLEFPPNPSFTKRVNFDI